MELVATSREPRRHTHDWAMAHRMSNIGERLRLPVITIFSDGERVVLNSAPTRARPAEPPPYLSQVAAVVRAPIFEDAVESYLGSVLDQLNAKKIKETNLIELGRVCQKSASLLI